MTYKVKLALPTKSVVSTFHVIATLTITNFFYNICQKKKSINIVYNVHKEEEIIISINENDTNDQFY